MRAIAIGIALLGACHCREDRPLAPPTHAAPIMLATRPTAPPSLPVTVIAWSIAESAKTAHAWDAAATAYERELDTCDDCRDTLYAIILARKNGLKAEPIAPPPGDQPASVPQRVQAVVDALDHYIAVADPTDPDLAGMKFLAANALGQWRQPDAVARFEAVLRDHPSTEVAEYAANLLLHSLVRENRIAELRIWVDRLLADAAFLANKPQLRTTLEQLRARLAE